MEISYKLTKVRELAGGDEDFIMAIAAAFIEEVPEAITQIEVGLKAKNFKQVYQNAHKIKPTIDMFDIAAYDELIVVQDWGKFEENNKDVTQEFSKLNEAVNKVVEELQADFGL